VAKSIYDNYNRTNSPDSNFFEREAIRSLGHLNRNCSWHDLTISVLFVLNISWRIYLRQSPAN